MTLALGNLASLILVRCSVHLECEEVCDRQSKHVVFLSYIQVVSTQTTLRERESADCLIISVSSCRQRLGPETASSIVGITVMLITVIVIGMRLLTVFLTGRLWNGYTT